MKVYFNALIALIIATASAFVQAEVAVIVNSGSNATPTQSDVANIFLGKDKSLKGIDQKDWNPVKEKFYGAITNKNESQLKSYWSGLIFTGKGQPLSSVTDDSAVVDRVGTETEAIGYVDKGAVTDKVKVLFTLP